MFYYDPLRSPESKPKANGNFDRIPHKYILLTVNLTKEENSRNSNNVTNSTSVIANHGILIFLLKKIHLQN